MATPAINAILSMPKGSPGSRLGGRDPCYDSTKTMTPCYRADVVTPTKPSAPLEPIGLTWVWIAVTVGALAVVLITAVHPDTKWGGT